MLNGVVVAVVVNAPKVVVVMKVVVLFDEMRPVWCGNSNVQFCADNFI